jgi:hypothetical protein
MEHQKCRICGNRHRLGPCPSPARELCKVAEEVVPALVPTPPLSNAQLQTWIAAAFEDAVTRVLNAAQKPAFDRRAYQREYMRRRRKAKKEAVTGSSRS